MYTLSQCLLFKLYMKIHLDMIYFHLLVMFGVLTAPFKPSPFSAYLVCISNIGIGNSMERQVLLDNIRVLNSYTLRLYIIGFSAASLYCDNS